MKHRKKIILFQIFCFITMLAEENKWVVVTTINYPTKELVALSNIPGWNVVVVADKKTPRDWSLPKVHFLDIEAQQKLGYKITELLSYNHYSRKNIGYLYAIERGATIIYDTDDDNVPIEKIIYHLSDKECELDVCDTSDDVINIYAYFGHQTVWPRGYPLNKILKNSVISFKKGICRPLIQQGLVDGDPDVDAIFRLTRKNDFIFEKRAPIALPKGVFCPFNTQNTIFYKEAFWGLFIPTTTTFRTCDIWRGYVTQRLLWEISGNLTFLHSTAVQKRNDHNLIYDFKSENDLYCKADQIIYWLSHWKPTTPARNIGSLFFDLTIAMIGHKFYGEEELEVARAWLQDLARIGYSFPLIVK